MTIELRRAKCRQQKVVPQWASRASALALCAFLLVGCGGNSSSSVSGGTSVAVSPSSASLTLGATQTFTSSVSATFSICDSTGANCGPGNALEGTISSTGVYTAPTPGAFAVGQKENLVIKATSTSTNQSGQATLTVTDPKSASIAWKNKIASTILTGATIVGTSAATDSNDTYFFTAVETPVSGLSPVAATYFVTNSGNSSVGVAPGDPLKGVEFFQNVGALYAQAISGNVDYLTGDLVGGLGESQVFLADNSYSLTPFPDNVLLFDSPFNIAGSGRGIVVINDPSGVIVYLAYGSGNNSFLMSAKAADGTIVLPAVEVQTGVALQSMATTNGNYTVSGLQTDSSGNVQGTCQVTTVDANGQLVWERDISGVDTASGCKVAASQVATDNVVYLGYVDAGTKEFAIHKLDGSTGSDVFQVEWDTGNPGTQLAFGGLAVNADGSQIALVGGSPQLLGDGSTLDGIVLALDSSGNFTWWARVPLLQEFGTAGTFSISCATFGLSGNLAGAGNTASSVSPNLLTLSLTPPQ